MDVIEINKILANKTRVEILKWLKDPENNFPPHRELGHFDFGVCGLFIQQKSGLSQSTISHFLNVMQKAGLLTATRIGKWTYFKRNEETINAYTTELMNNL